MTRTHLLRAIRILRAVESCEQFLLGDALIGLDVNDVHPDVPLAKRALFELGVGRVVNLENEERDQFCRETRQVPAQVRRRVL